MNFIYNISLLSIIFLSCVFLTSAETIKITMAEGSGTWWFGMALSGASTTTSSISIKDSGSSYNTWTELKPTQWSSSVFEFITSGNPVQLPLSVRLISKTNDVLVLMKSVNDVSSGIVIDTDANYVDTKTPTQTASSTATAQPTSSGSPPKSPSSSTANKPATPAKEAAADPNYTPDNTASIKQTTPNKGQTEVPNPMSSCSPGRSSLSSSDSLHSGSCGFGNLLGPTGTGNMYVAAASINMIEGGIASCGDCFQITGPLGAVIVTVVDSCSSIRCSDGIPHLDLSQEAYDAIADRNKSSTVYISYRKVTCPVVGNVKINNLGTSANAMEYRIFNNRVGIINASLSTSDSKTIYLEKTKTNTWKYKGSSALSFPVTLMIRSQTNNVISYQFNNANDAANYGTIIDTLSQVAGVPRLYGGSNTNAACAIPTETTTPIIYSDIKLTADSADLFWVDHSFQSSIDYDFRNNPYKGTSCIKMAMGSHGGLQVARNIGIPWSFFNYTHLQFYVRGDSYFNQLRVGWNNGYETTIEVTTAWTVKNITLASMNAPNTVGSSPNTLMFTTALSSGTPVLYLDEVQFVRL